jgi:hypothetical protein
VFRKYSFLIRLIRSIAHMKKFLLPLFSLAILILLLFPAGYAMADLVTVPFTYSAPGGQQTWVVPTGVSSVTVDMAGAGTGQCYLNGWYYKNGGRVQTTLTVTPGSTLYIYVGGQPSDTAGGYNGGGNGTNTYYNLYGVGGGGASDIRTSGDGNWSHNLNTRLVVAAGAGGRGNSSCGGNGGGLTGESTSGGGGTQTAGGINGGSGATDGGLGYGGLGGASWEYGGGGGGGGYYGGGGGGGDAGGGGGSSYTPDNCTSPTTCTSGFQSGNGYVNISYPYPLFKFFYNVKLFQNVKFWYTP